MAEPGLIGRGLLNILPRPLGERGESGEFVIWSSPMDLSVLFALPGIPDARGLIWLVEGRDIFASELAVGAISLEETLNRLPVVLPAAVPLPLPLTRLPLTPKDETFAPALLPPVLVPIDETPATELFLLMTPTELSLLVLAVRLRVDVQSKLGIGDLDLDVDVVAFDLRVPLTDPMVGGLRSRLDVDPPDTTRLVDGRATPLSFETDAFFDVFGSSTGSLLAAFGTGIFEVWGFELPLPQKLCTTDLAEERNPNRDLAFAVGGNQ